jgi:D-glycero-D-manno-heptose 1,7-bisphosphate phosphatase
MSSLPRLVILDRDGVINEDSDDYIRSADEWIPIEGSLEAIARLNQAGILVAVASNQSGLGRGFFTPEDLNRMHAKFQRLLARIGGHVDAIFFCPHTPEAGCECRKPAPGLLRSVSLRFGLPLNSVPFIGDSKSDVEAAQAARARPVLVRTGKGVRTLANNPELKSLPCYANLAEAVDALLDGNALT